MRLLGNDDADLAAVLGLSRQAAQQRRTGGARLRPQDMEDIADAWQLPIELFRMDPTDALDWLVNERRMQVLQASRCINAERSSLVTAAA
jgi:hypothetical protein